MVQGFNPISLCHHSSPKQKNTHALSCLINFFIGIVLVWTFFCWVKNLIWSYTVSAFCCWLCILSAVNHLSSLNYKFCLHFLGIGHIQKAGTDVLLDLLSIGTPVQSSSPTTDILSSSQNDKSPIATLDALSSPSSLSAQATSSARAAPMMDLLDGFGPSPPKPGKVVHLEFLFCCLVAVPVVAVPVVDLPFFLWTEDNGSVYPPLVAFQSSSLRITFNFSKQPGNPQTTLIQATFTNLTPNVFTDFIFQAAVPKVNPDVFQSASFLLFLYHMLYHNIFFLANLVLWYFSFAFGVHLQFLQLHLDPASSNILPASGNGAITQNLRVTNSQHGKVFLMHCHLKLHVLQFLDFVASYDWVIVLLCNILKHSFCPAECPFGLVILISIYF